jgi:hypothetical protein
MTLNDAGNKLKIAEALIYTQDYMTITTQYGTHIAIWHTCSNMAHM